MARRTSLARDDLIEDLDRKAMAMSWLRGFLVLKT